MECEKPINLFEPKKDKYLSQNKISGLVCMWMQKESQVRREKKFEKRAGEFSQIIYYLMLQPRL